MSKDYSGLKENDTLQRFYDKHNSRLPVDPIPPEIGECKDNKALKVFDEKSDKGVNHTNDK